MTNCKLNRWQWQWHSGFQISKCYSRYFINEQLVFELNSSTSKLID